MTVEYRGSFQTYSWFFLQGLIGSAFLTIIFENFASGLLLDILEPQIAKFISIVILAPLIEEYFKIYPLFRRRSGDPRTLILFGFSIGLGFGVAEFLIYVFMVNIPVLIRLPGLLFHGASTVIATMGIIKGDLAKYYTVAVIVHAAINFLAQLGTVYIIGGLGTVLFTYVLAYKFYRST